jgi:hypothetical protein
MDFGSTNVRKRVPQVNPNDENQDCQKTQIEVICKNKQIIYKKICHMNYKISYLTF